MFSIGNQNQTWTSCSEVCYMLFRLKTNKRFENQVFILGRNLEAQPDPWTAAGDRAGGRRALRRPQTPLRVGVQHGKAAELRMHARARPRRTRNACAAGVQKWRFAGVETALPCPPGCVRAWLPVPWSLSTLPASIRRSQRLLRSFWRLGDRDFRQPTSTLSRPEAPAGRPDWRVQAAADDAVLRFTPFQRLLPAA